MSIALIYKNEGAIFGGYLRDTIAGIKPNDIDAVIPDVNKESFERSMASLGYEFESQHDPYDPTIYRKTGELDVEVIYGEDPPRSQRNVDFFIGPPAEPDFDVNLLAYDGTRMYNWMSLGGDPELDVLTIISQIVKRETVQFENAQPDRIEKMRSKGFKIMGVRSL